MDGIAREFDKLAKKPINKSLLGSVQQITALLEETKRRIQNGTPLHTTSPTLLLDLLLSGSGTNLQTLGIRRTTWRC
jgi:hypothetical protein